MLAQSLTRLALTHHKMNDAAATALATGLKPKDASSGPATGGGLRALSLATNAIGDAGLTALAEVLKANTSLQELNLSSNQIGTQIVCFPPLVFAFVSYAY